MIYRTKHGTLCRAGMRLGSMALLGVSMLLATRQGKAQIVLTPTVQQVGQEFHYDYSVINNSLDTTYYVVALQGLPGSTTVFDLAAPAGFKIDFDSHLGLITFLSDTQSFDPTTTVSGFSFDSFLQPTSTSIESTGFDALGNGVITEGFAPGPVPEPGVAPLLLAGLAGTVIALRRRRHLTAQ